VNVLFHPEFHSARDQAQRKKGAMRTEIIKAVAQLLSVLHGVLLQFNYPPPSTDLFFQPYVEIFRSLCREHNLDQSGVDSLQKFATRWDNHFRPVLNGEANDVAFSDAEWQEMSDALSELNDWLKSHFSKAAYWSQQATRAS